MLFNQFLKGHKAFVEEQQYQQSRLELGLRLSDRLSRGWRSIISDSPQCRHESQTDRGCMRGVTHDPDSALASRGVLPENVCLTVTVKVARSSDAPRCRPRSQTHSGLKRGVIHDPDSALASRCILPKNVRFAVPVKVARTSDAPRCSHRSQNDSGCMRGVIHDPDIALASRGVLPK